MSETIGSRAILDLSDFDNNALKYISTMRKMEQASDSQSSGFAKSFGSLPNVLGAAQGALGAFGGVLGNIFQIASGIIAANIFGNIASSISRMAGDALAAAANFQTLGIQMQGLIAIQIAEASRPTIITQASIDLTEKQTDSLSKLNDKYDDSTFKLATMEERLGKMNEKGQEGSATYNQLAHNISELKDDMAGWNAQADEIASKKDTIITIKTLGDRTIDMKEAMRQAKGPARELVDWISDFAVKTPFTVQQLAEMTRGFLSMGLAVAPSKALTTALSQLGAGMGLTQDQLNRIAQNVIQTGRSMKITERDIREFGNAGIPVNSVLDVMARKLGTTREGALKFAKSGKEGVEAFRDAIVDVANNDFPDALENISNTWNVAASNIKDVIESIFGKEVIGPILGDFAKIISSGIDSILGKREEFRKFGLQISGMFRLILPQAKAFADSVLRLSSTILKMVGIDLGKFNLHQFLIAARIAIQNFLEGATKFTDWINATLPKVVEWGKEFWKAITEGDTTKIGEMLKPIGDAISQWITDQSAELSKKFKEEWLPAFTDWATDLSAAITKKWNDEWLPAIKQWVADQAAGLSQKVKDEWGPALVDWLKVDAPVLAEKLGKITGDILNWVITDGIPQMEQAGKDLIAALFPSADGSKGGANKGGGNQDSTMKTIAGGIISAFLKGLKESAQERAPEVRQVLFGMLVNIGAGEEAAVSGFAAIGVAIVQKIAGAILASGPAILSNLTTTILISFMGSMGITPSFVGVGLALVGNIVSGIQSLIANIPANVTKGISDALVAASGMAGSFVGIGVSIVSGLVSGVLSKAKDIADAVVKVIKDAFGAGESAIDSGSPSRLAAKVLGKPIPLGVEQGILSGLPNVVRATRTVMMAAVSPQNSAANSYAYNNTRTQNTNLNLSVNTRETTQSVVSNFAVMQAMAGV